MTASLWSTIVQREGTATHCGRCFQCVDRRLAMFAAGQEKRDDSALYTIDITRQPIPSEESRTTAVDYLRQAAQFADSSVDAFSVEHLSELADTLDALPTQGGDLERVERVWRLMRAHGDNVRSGLRRIRELYDDPLAPLPAGSLPSLVSTREHLRPAVLRLADAPFLTWLDVVDAIESVSNPHYTWVCFREFLLEERSVRPRIERCPSTPPLASM